VTIMSMVLSGSTQVHPDELLTLSLLNRHNVVIIIGQLNAWSSHRLDYASSYLVHDLLICLSFILVSLVTGR